MLTDNFSRLFAILTASMLILAVLQPKTAYACSCGIGTYEGNLERSDAAFVGHVDTITQLRNKTDSGGYYPYYHVKFTIDNLYKGKVERNLTIATDGDTASCGYPFQEGMTYLVFAYYDENRFEEYEYANYGLHWATSLCSGNEWNPSDDILSILSEASAQMDAPPPVILESTTIEESDSINWLWILPVLLGSSVAIFASRRGQVKEKKPSDL